MKVIKAIVILVVVLLILGGFFYWSLRRMIPSNMGQQAPPPTVDVAEPIIEDVVNYSEFTGNLDAVESVDIRARVEGYLQRVAFEDGAFVKAGQVLFEIEPETYQAARDRAQAQLESAQADLERAKEDYQRGQEAVKSNAISAQQVSTYKAQRDMAAASVLAAKAALEQAELNLSYTTIKSPIDGKIGRNLVDAGNLVGAGGNTLLATVVTLDPIYVYFNVSESEYLNYTRDVATNLADEPNQLPLYLSMANKQDYAYQGHLDYMSNKVDPETGTLQIRGVVPNPGYQLYPGMFVRLRVPTQTVNNAILVQGKAIGTDIGGKFLLVVDKDDIVRHRPVELGPQRGQLQVITSGLSPNERYIVSGLQTAYPGTKVTPVPAGSQPPASAQPQQTTQTAEQPAGANAE